MASDVVIAQLCFGQHSVEVGGREDLVEGEVVVFCRKGRVICETVLHTDWNWQNDT